jgi:peptidyl-prolyl cis-trans isomerase D
VAAAELGGGVAVGDDELQKWVEEHQDKYRTKPRVRVRYVAYTTADFADMAKPGDPQVQAYYDEHVADRFTSEEKVRARHILVKTDAGADDAKKAEARKKAEGLLARAKGGADFAELARKQSDDPGSATKGGDLGLFSRGQMVPPFEAAAFALEPGQLSEVVESPFGFHVIKVEEKKPAGARPLAEVRDEIVKTLTDERALELARKQADADRRAVVRGKTLAEAAGQRPVQETPPFEQGGIVPGVGFAKRFADTAFALGVGQPSDLIETDKAVYLLEPIEQLPPAVPPLAEIRGRVEADVKRARAEARAKEKAEQLLAKAREVGLEKAAVEAGIALDTTGPFERRTGVVPKLGGGSTELRADAFALTPEAPLAPKVYVVTGDAVVVALAERIPADAAGLGEARDEIREALRRERQQLAVEQFMTFLKERAQREGALAVHTDAIG